MNEPQTAPNFIRHIIADDNASGKYGGRVVTRFPPEPNGFLHIGHAKSICLNFGVAAEHGGQCYLRFDDTNPLKESEEYALAIERDIRWLGFDWQGQLTYASDYFAALYDYAIRLIETDLAYVCSLSPEQIREYRGTLTEPGRDSPYRDRSRAENLAMFAAMRAGEFADGEHVLRARIDMASANLNLRDPILYRIRKVAHQRTGDAWCIYPMYDFAHSLSDAIERITHSLCTLEFEDHRPLYDWFQDQLIEGVQPQQIEFSRLNLANTVTSKRKLKTLIDLGHVGGWEDPRMPTLAGMRRRGYPPEAIRDFCERAGVTKKSQEIQLSALENSVREALDKRSRRVMAVLRPLKIVIDNYPADLIEQMPARNHPNDPDMGERELPFSRELYIEAEDFMEDPPRKFFRLRPGGEVRLRYGYIIKCLDVIKDADGEVIELHCSYDPETRSGSAQSGRKVKGTIHWVSVAHAIPVEVRLYDRLFRIGSPDSGDEDFVTHLNPDSLEALAGCRVEPSLANAQPGEYYQFERQGYFGLDVIDSQPDALVFNRTVALRDSWAKLEKQQLQKSPA